MQVNMSKRELVALHSHLVRQLRYFHNRPSEWQFWNSTYSLSDLDKVLKKLQKQLEKGN